MVLKRININLAQETTNILSIAILGLVYIAQLKSGFRFLTIYCMKLAIFIEDNE